MTQETSDRYRLCWSWPYRAIATMLAVLGMSYPLLRRYVEWRQLDTADWIIAGGTILLALVVGNHFSLRIAVTGDEVARIGWLHTRQMRWSHIRTLEIRESKFVLHHQDGSRLAVPMGMKNGEVFARDLNGRFTETGVPR